ncbi:hypothetical protein ABZ215_38540 [Amycolatopsis sp. NPDC006131]|uniref:hypothetical protein n=1 Tax=Amycolatopsis sp. NPDC006131 TaxID=3156731 RepID=UPI0033A37973
MAVLPDLDRNRIWRWFMRQNSEPCAFTKTDLRAAVDATDSWIDSNASSFNTALPAAFRTNASLTQKTLLFCYVAMRRAGLLKVQEDS